jgi:hypothetical protein
VLRTFALAIAVTFLPMTAFCQDTKEHAPASLLGFLKPKMHVGIKFHSGTTDVNLSILDAEDYAPALDIATSNSDFVDAKSLADKYNVVRTRLEAHLSKLPDPELNEAQDRVRVYPLRGYFFGTVQSVGKDFVLIEYVQHRTADRKTVRVALNRTSIARIYLDFDPIMFTSR